MVSVIVFLALDADWIYDRWKVFYTIKHPQKSSNLRAGALLLIIGSPQIVCHGHDE
jgi:hypothetical protein